MCGQPHMDLKSTCRMLAWQHLRESGVASEGGRVTVLRGLLPRPPKAGSKC